MLPNALDCALIPLMAVFIAPNNDIGSLLRTPEHWFARASKCRKRASDVRYCLEEPAPPSSARDARFLSAPRDPLRAGVDPARKVHRAERARHILPIAAREPAGPPSAGRPALARALPRASRSDRDAGKPFRRTTVAIGRPAACSAAGRRWLAGAARPAPVRHGHREGGGGGSDNQTADHTGRAGDGLGGAAAACH